MLPTKPVVQSFLLTKVKTGWCNKKLLCSEYIEDETPHTKVLHGTAAILKAPRTGLKSRLVCPEKRPGNSYQSLESPASGHRGYILNGLFKKEQRQLAASKIKQHDVAHNYTAEFPPLKWGLHPKPAALGTCYALNPVQALSRRASAGVNQDRTRDHTNNKASHVTARQYISLSNYKHRSSLIFCL